MAAANPIVTINVSQTIAPTPSNLQKMGVFISQGGTTLAAGKSSLLTQLSDLAVILAGGKTIASITWTGGIATVTLAAPHTWVIGDQVGVVISGVTPVGYNGSFSGTVTTTTAFTIPLATNPGITSSLGVATDADVGELNQMNTSFFAQGSSLSVYVLELGESVQTPAEGIAALTTWLANNTNVYYHFLLPREWDASSAALVTLAKQYASNTAMVYFHVTTSLTNYAVYTGTKSVVMSVETVADTANGVVFAAAARMWQFMSPTPSATSKVAPFAFRFLVGLTANAFTGPQRVALKAAYCNYCASGSEGGLSNVIDKFGLTADGRDFIYWYAVDWLNINLKLNLANEIINGSNNSINPLYYNQDGINRLQAKAQSTYASAVSYGLFLAGGLVTATDFVTYNTNNPNDYKVGAYNGLALTATPSRGFITIIFSLNITDFVTT